MSQPLSSAYFLCIALIALYLFHTAAANVEKEIFLGLAPSKETFNVTGRLPRLVPSEHCSNCRAISTRLSTSFMGKGAEHWIQIDALEEGKRYEVRICWAATQPTDFTLDLFTPDQILSEASLVEGIQNYRPCCVSTSPHSVQAVLYLRVLARASYISSSASRMENPEPVDVDIILDPYLYNVIPESLLGIIALIVVVSIASWWLGGWIHKGLLTAVRPAASAKLKGKIL